VATATGLAVILDISAKYIALNASEPSGPAFNAIAFAFVISLVVGSAFTAAGGLAVILDISA
jgi:hypothetical protein